MVQRLAILLLLTVFITSTLSFSSHHSRTTSTITMTTIDKSKSLTQADYKAKLTSKSATPLVRPSTPRAPEVI